MPFATKSLIKPVFSGCSQLAFASTLDNLKLTLLPSTVASTNIIHPSPVPTTFAAGTNIPTTTVFNLRALPSDALICYQAHQAITKTIGVNGLNQFLDHTTGKEATQKLHQDKFSIGE